MPSSLERVEMLDELVMVFEMSARRASWGSDDAIGKLVILLVV